MDPNTYYLRTFGCQMNDHDSEHIAGLLEGMGLRRRARPDEAEVLVFNTCSIREKADRRLAAHLREAGHLKEDGPRLIVVAGCLAQSRKEGLVEDFPFVDVLVGPQSLHELPRLISERRATGRWTGAFHDETTHFSAELPRADIAGPTAWVQIMAGCSNYCTYCIVPYVRGPEASRPPLEIVREIEGLVTAGLREVTLLGQNVNAYGLEPGFSYGVTFPDLLELICEVEGIQRVRFLTSHPKDFSDRLIEVIAAPNQVCEQVHLPVQSGSDRVLAAMGRHYDRRTYLDLVARLRAAVPEVSLTTDIIVGFPGETEAEFEDTLSLVEEIRFDGAFTFIFSPRPGTAAARLPDRVPRDVAEQRLQRLVDLVQRVARERNQAWVGRTVEVLVERPSRQSPGEVMGRTRGYKPVNFVSKAPPGALVQVELLDATSTSFKGREIAGAGALGPAVSCPTPAGRRLEAAAQGRG